MRDKTQLTIKVPNAPVLFNDFDGDSIKQLWFIVQRTELTETHTEFLFVRT